MNTSETFAALAAHLAAKGDLEALKLLAELPVEGVPERARRAGVAGMFAMASTGVVLSAHQAIARALR